MKATASYVPFFTFVTVSTTSSTSRARLFELEAAA